jgi:exopolysaccharide biosynthesis polyprenyl glycosylphosphotransferase
MYQKGKSVWQKHLDFILLDVICLQIVYIVSYFLRHRIFFPYMNSHYRNLGLLLILLQICVGFFTENYKDILRRGYFEEFKKTAIYVTVVVMFIFTYLFLMKTSRIFSRVVFLQLWIFGILILYIERVCRKLMLRRKMEDEKWLQSLIIVTTKVKIESILSSLQKKRYTGFYIRGIILTDSNQTEKAFQGIPVVACKDNAYEYLKENVVDEVFIDLPETLQWRKQLVETCTEMGITTHLSVENSYTDNPNLIVEKFEDYIVLTSSIRVVEARQLFIKRMMDIAGSLVGLVATALLVIIFGPIIYLQSPGPIFFSQERVGKNGRKFRIYKFRSMYLDAEKRKKDLMEQNKMQGFMFKIDNDPRVIPIGRFMRKTSLDEFPQFFNVLKGDMSLVGTRPPTVDEYEQYELHHKARLAAKPGLTGMWQVSGRSDIVDFEEVVRLDKRYITEWNIGMDLRILFETVKIVITGKGSV